MAALDSKQNNLNTTMQREGFTSTLGAIAATLGSAVGLGNIWKFPYVTGENGGAAFIIVYLIFVLLIGLPLMLGEFIVGRRAQANTVGAYRRLAPDQPWFLGGYMGILAAILIMAFYSEVAGWVLAYIAKAASGALNGISGLEAEHIFAQLQGQVWQPLIWQWVVFLIIAVVIACGVQKGIERMTRTLLPILFVLLLICDIRALTLPGAGEGLRFLFAPDFSKITGPVLLAAMGLAFFKLSLGVGTMMTYGSYMTRADNLPQTAAKVAFSDFLVSILAGIAIFPAVFAFGLQPEAGASLLFLTIPMVFNAMPLGSIFLVIFFVLAGVASIGAMISLVEVPVAFLVEEKGWKRSRATGFTIFFMAVLGILATLSGSTLSDQQIFGMNWFNLYDYISSSILMPVGGLIVALFVGWHLKYPVIRDEASNDGTLNNAGLMKVYTVIIRYITPVAIIVILLSGLGVISL